MARKSKYSSNENISSKKIWSVALYIRLSQEDEDNGQDKLESNSVTSQKTLLNEFIEKHDDLIVYDCYIDEIVFDKFMIPTNFTAGQVYISSLGEIVFDCDLSYETQAKYSIGNINDNSLYSYLKEIILSDDFDGVYGCKIAN